MGLESIQRKDNKIRNDSSKGYSEYKEFEGRKYTGMRVGGTHHGIMIRANGRRKK
jgi:hypothetical protein